MMATWYTMAYDVPKDSSSDQRTHDYWLVTVLEDRAESAPAPAEEDER